MESADSSSKPLFVKFHSALLYSVLLVFSIIAIFVMPEALQGQLHRSSSQSDDLWMLLIAAAAILLVAMMLYLKFSKAFLLLAASSALLLIPFLIGGGEGLIFATAYAICLLLILFGRAMIEVILDFASTRIANVYALRLFLLLAPVAFLWIRLLVNSRFAY
jgi:hypothetical protein